MRFISYSFFIIASFLIISDFAKAACTAPAGAAGQFQYISGDMKYCDGVGWISLTISTTGNACSTPGMIQKNTNDIQFCNASNFWVNMDSGVSDGSCTNIGMITRRNGNLEWCNPSSVWKILGTPADHCADGMASIGEVCPGGALFAGGFGDRYLMVTPSGCTNSATPTCAGGNDTVNKIWNGSGGSSADIAGITNVGTGAGSVSPSTETGDVITPIITADASTSSNSAADFCNDMVYGGYTDWFLPSKGELAYLYCRAVSGSHNTANPQESPNCLGFKGKVQILTGFSGNYWASTEVSSTNAHYIQLNDGAQYGDGKGSSNKVRCIRKYTPTTDPCTVSTDVGTICNSGIVRAGTFKNATYYVTPGGCNDSTTPTCNGVDRLKKAWASGFTETGVTDGDNGDVNSAYLATNIAGSAAAQYCENMNYGGYTDWYLPAINELQHLYQNSLAIGGFATEMSNREYVTSTESPASSYWAITFATGAVTNFGKTTAHLVRCIRKDVVGDRCSGSPAIGVRCNSGAIYAGQFDGGNYMITPGGCTNSTTPTCSGTLDTVSRAWRGSTGSNADIAGINNIAAAATVSVQRGDVLTPLIVADASTSSDSAADYCEDMTFAGFSDWYLPSKSELAYIGCHVSVPSPSGSDPSENPGCTSYGGRSNNFGGFANDSYLSSTENTSANVWKIFRNDAQATIAKSTAAKVRCVRRY